MKITVHRMLAAQREVLTLPAAQRREAILQLLDPFSAMVRMVVPPGMDPIAMFGLMRPDGPEDGYREALERLESADAEAVCLQALDRSQAAMAATGHALPLAEIQFGLFLLDQQNPMMARLTQGYTGFGGIPGYIMVSLWPNDYNLPRLQAVVAHEFNHQIRNSYEPWKADISLGEYMVLEGLAESFAAELYGPEATGPWVTALGAQDLERAREVVGRAVDVRGFNEVRGYIFGDEVMAAFGAKPLGAPAYAGYAVGYRLVQAYLQKTGKSAAEATFVPSNEIIGVADYL